MFVDNFDRDPSLIWQYFGSAKGFFRQYPGEYCCVDNYDSDERSYNTFLCLGFWVKISLPSLRKKMKELSSAVRAQDRNDKVASVCVGGFSIFLKRVIHRVARAGVCDSVV